MANGLLTQQVKALVKKDFWIIRAHKKAVCAEILIPILMASLTAMMLNFLSTIFVESSSNIGELNSPDYQANYFIAPPWLFPDLQSFALFRNDTMEAGMQQYQQYFQHDPTYAFLGAMGFFASNATANRAAFSAADRLNVAYSQIQSNVMLSFGSMVFGLYNPLAVEAAGQLAIGGSSESGSMSATGVRNATPLQAYAMPATVFYGNNYNLVQMVASITVLFTAFAFFPLLNNSAGRLTDEKRAKMREHLRVMGVRPTAYILSVYGSGALRVLFVAVVVLIAISAAHGLDASTTAVFLLLLTLFGLSLVSVSQLMPAFFSRSAFSTGTCLLFLLGGIFGGLFSSQIPAGVQFALAFLFSPIAYGYAGGVLIGGFNVTLPVPFGVSLLFLLLQVFWYALLSQYLCAVFPGEYGVPQSPLFPCYRLRRAFSRRPHQAATSMKEVGICAAQDAIVLRDLVKCYGSQRETRAVNNLNLTVKQGEIFVLLGHNGAGKTTTISMLTGMLDSTSYAEASVAGLDLAKDIDLIRNRIGSCPQFDILFEDLSGQQHMEIFSRIKGVPPAAGEELLRLLGLPLDRQPSRTYSGGMKRRLSVACALVGGSNIIFLDEPSSGLDPVSRRQLWDLLRFLRSQGRTIVLTTHFMEEADYLGDRIAIMSHGRLYCCDTSTALKHQYGVGYYLTLVKTPTAGRSEDHQPRAAVPAEQILARIREHCPEATLHHESMGDVQFVLPLQQLKTFGKVLGMVEKNLAELGATSYGVRMNSLEDVFLSISQKESQSRSNGEDPLDTSGLDTSTLTDGRSTEEEFAAAAQVGMVRLFFSQLLTVMVKKWWNLKRSKRMWFLGIFMPMVLTAAGFATVIELPRMSTQIASGTRYVDVFDWVVPTVGELTPLQGEYLELAAKLYPKYVNTINPLVPNSDGTAADSTSVRLSFRTISADQAATGSFIDTRSLAFQDMLDDENPVQISFQNLTYDEIWGADGLSFTNHYLGLDVSFYASSRFSPVCAFFLYQLLYIARVELFRRYNPSIPPAVWPNYTMVPFPPVVGAEESASSSDSSEGVQGRYIIIPLGVFILIAIAEYAANAALEVADELNRHIFHTLRMHGLSAFAYWFGTLLFDSLVSVLIIGVFIGGVYVRRLTFLQDDFLVWVSFQTLGAVVHLLLISYALVAVLPTLKPSTYIAAILGFVTASITVPVIIFVIAITTGGTKESVLRVNEVFMWPARALEFTFEATDPQTFFSTGPGRVAFASVWFWSAAPILVLVWYTSKSTRGRRAAAVGDTATLLSSAFGVNTPLLAAVTQSHTDPDVAAEAQRVLRDPSGNMAATIHLRQDYGGKKLAVRDMTFGVRRGECFGLLGPNGAGKTTTVKMLLQELAPSNGTATFPYSSVTLDTTCFLDAAYRKIRLGVCQQHDTLWEAFSDREHMEMYLRIRLGPRYSPSLWKAFVGAAIRKVFLESDGKRAETYSGGMKRKLSVCLALYTGSLSIFLDEPSTGMDPFARRAMWKSINEALEADRCVLLTTHSMEEADSVCSRIAIVTDGTMQCIGSGQHLKNRFGKGYSITVTLTDDSDANIEMKAGALDAAMATAFGARCTRTERIGTTVHYSVPELSVADAFDVLASKQAEWSVDSYSVNQVTSLEQIFVAFAGRSVVDS